MVEDPSTGALDMERLFQSAGAVGADMMKVDWGQTPLGPPATWPQSLRSIVHVVLTSRFSMWMAWGPELTFICNDKYRRDTLGSKYPWALGRPAAEVWAEIWTDIGPRIELVLRTGVASWDESLLLILERGDYPEETYHTFSYSPLSDGSGAVSGILCVVKEDTERVIGDRRMNVLRRLSETLTSAQTEEEVASVVSETLATDQTVLPFALLYEFDDDGAHLTSCAGATPGGSIAPWRVLDGAAPWPIARIATEPELLVDDLADRFSDVPSGGWDEPATSALLVRVEGAPGAPPYGALVAGLNRYRLLDQEYRGFLDLLASQISASLSNARAYEAERQRAEDLAALDRAKTAFFTNVSHEFRTPLTLILGPTADALNDRHDPLSVSQRARVDTIHQSSERLLKLVNTLLDFSRLESGRTEAHLEAVDLAEETMHIAEMFRSAVERAGLTFTVECQRIETPVDVDREMWAKIVSNLLSNALKFTFEGGITLRLTFDDDMVELAVLDSGVGIEAEDQVHLFERFHRVEGARSRTFEGSGIGLALVSELVGLHGGSIDAASAPGVGSTFTVHLPLGASAPGIPVTDAPVAQAPVAGTPGADAPVAQGRFGHEVASTYVAEAMRWLAPSDGESATDTLTDGRVRRGGYRPTVLVADDNPDMRRYIAGLLDDSYDVVTVEDGTAALAAAHSVRPDLILSDVMMPGLDGFGLLQALRTDAATALTPVILLSARAGEDSAVEGLEAGADDYLVKPFSAVELLARVRSNLELERTRRAATRREHEIAVELQEKLAPKRSPHVPLLEIATYYQPGVLGTQVGGDWFEAIDLGRARTALVVGDVMGKGIPAAATMGQLRSVVRAYAGLDLSPADLMEAADARVREFETEQIASCIYAVVDSRASSLEFANAGHPPPVLIDAGAGTVARLHAPLGPPLGAGPAAYRQRTVPLEPGSMVVLYTDGLVETRAGDTDERIDRVAQVARAWSGAIDLLPAALVSELCPSGPSDDVAILVARVLPVDPLPSSETLIEPDLTGAATARRFASETVSRWPSRPARGELDLLVSELVTNAVVHGSPPIRLRLTHLGDEVLVEVEDSVAYTPHRRHPGTEDEHGRGLRILAMLARRWGVSRSQDGKTVWCTLAVLPSTLPSTSGGG
jgi:signal transduction histidine kinase/serine phosphatase RsbU (regulator of sigma subunit)/anti-sigma regulatory factor (Ser/Thr protein kinase)